MFLTCNNGLVSAIFLRNLRVQNTKPVRPLRNLYDTIDQCGYGVLKRAQCTPKPLTLVAQCGFAARRSKSACFVVPPLFRADSGVGGGEGNLIKQGGTCQRTTKWL